MSNSADMSELLANAFSAVFVDGAPPIASQHQSFGDVLDEYVSPENVDKVLSGWNSSSAAGSDSLLPYLKKASSASLSLPFYLLFERPLDKGVLPNLW